MYIMSQNADAHIEYHGAALRAQENGMAQIVAVMPNGNGKVIGTYSFNRAQIILSEIAASNESGIRSLYTMPGE